MDKKVVLVSHGHLAEGVANAVEMVFGKNDALAHYGLTPDGNVVELIQSLCAEVEANEQIQYVILADIFGGSVCNQCLQRLSACDNVKLVAGLNMALVLGILSIPGALSNEQLAQAIEEAREGIREVELIRADAPVDDGADDFF